MKTVLKEDFCTSHDMAIELLKKNPDSHILTLAEIYRNCSVERDVALSLIDAFKGALGNLYTPQKILAKNLVPLTIKFLEEQT